MAVPLGNACMLLIVSEDKTGWPEGLGAGGPVGASVEGAQPQREPCQPQ